MNQETIATVCIIYVVTEIELTTSSDERKTVSIILYSFLRPQTIQCSMRLIR